MYLEEIALTAQRPLSEDDSKIENMSRVVCALIAKSIRQKVKTKGFWKVSIRFNHPDSIDQNKVISGVLTLYKDFPVVKFLSSPLRERQEFMLNFVTHSLKHLDRDLLDDDSKDDWEDLIEGSLKYVLDEEFKNTIVGKKRYKNGDGSETAYIECEQEMDEARVYLSIKPKRGKRRRIFIDKTVPEEFIFQDFFGHLEWFDNFVLLKKASGDQLKIPIYAH